MFDLFANYETITTIILQTKYVTCSHQCFFSSLKHKTCDTEI